MTNFSNNSLTPKEKEDASYDTIRILLLGDDSVGKSKLVNRYLFNEFTPRTFLARAVGIHKKDVVIKDGLKKSVEIWDFAGHQAHSPIIHAAIFHIHVCIFVFDVTRKQTYTNLETWFGEVKQINVNIPCIVVANKIDVDYKVTNKSFKFAKENNMPFFFASAADSANVSSFFEEAIQMVVNLKSNSEWTTTSEILRNI